MLLKSRKFLLLLVVLMALLAIAVVSVSAGGFNREPVYNLDGFDYIIKPIPGHEWNQAGPNQAVGKHYNTGPGGSAQWWSSDADDGELLYIVHGIIDTWSTEQAAQYAARGYVHYHELIKVEGGAQHLTKVIWLKHTARTSFDLDGGPMPGFAHEVTPGVDFEFIPTGSDPYP
jgi:selenium-binding protein 1